MMKRTILAAASGLSLVMAAAPLQAQDDTASTPDPASAPAPAPATGELEAIGTMMAGLFQSEPLTAEQEARLPTARAIIDRMMPEGFYGEMMGEMMGGIMQPMMQMMSGANGASLALGSRLDIDPARLDALSDEQKIELATMLDPAFGERGAIMENWLNSMMIDAAVAIEPGYREGMAQAYAVRFDERQLADISAFFATPSGAVFARENVMLMADPRVMSSSMQALPAMMEQMGDMEAELEERMAALPAERSLDQFSDAERRAMAELLGVDVAQLDGIVMPPSADADQDSDSW